jgi:hypothetical protein
MAIGWFEQSRGFSMIGWWIGVVALLTLTIWCFRKYRSSLPTAAGAILMSLGIMINGNFQQVTFLRKEVAPFATVVLIALFVFFAGVYIRDAVRGVFYERHLNHPVASFAVGTWVAGISVTVVAIVKELPEVRTFALILLLCNLVL